MALMRLTKCKCCKFQAPDQPEVRLRRGRRYIHSSLMLQEQKGSLRGFLFTQQ